MVTIVATPFAFVVGLAVVVGVSGWIGYLLGRLRSVTGPGRAAPEPDAGRARAIFTGAAFLGVAGLTLATVFWDGMPRSVDGAGLFVMLLGLAMLAFGAYYVNLARQYRQH
jgi:hypothetical protein